MSACRVLSSLRASTTQRLSVRTRLALASTALFLVVAAVTSWAVVDVVRSRIEDRTRQDASDALVSVATQAAAGVPIDAISTTGGFAGVVRVLDDQGRVIGVLVGRTEAGTMTVFGPGPLGLSEASGSFGSSGLLDARSAAGAEPYATSGSGTGVGGWVDTTPADRAAFLMSLSDVDVLSVREQVMVGGRPLTFVAEHPLADVERSVDALADALRVLTPLVALAFGVAVWLFAGRALRPVEELRGEVEAISHSTLHRRLTLPRAKDEVRRLGLTMNGMLDRLELASVRQRTFVADASHELRTPVSVVRANLEVALRSDDPVVLRDAASRALDANARLQAIVDDLLDLAQLDDPVAAAASAARSPVDLEELVFADVRQRGAYAPAGAPSFDTGAVSAARVAGRPPQLARIVQNLLDNASTHARRRIAIVLRTEGDVAVLHVDDDGPGVPAGDRAAIFERFTRLDAGRARRAGGAGLGLAITARVVDAHGGTIAVSDAPLLGGARFTVRLPLAAG